MERRAFVSSTPSKVRRDSSGDAVVIDNEASFAVAEKLSLAETSRDPGKVTSWWPKVERR